MAIDRFLFFPGRENVLVGYPGLQGRKNGFRRIIMKNGPFCVLIGIPKRKPHHEAVELCCGKRVGSFSFNRILRGDNEKERAYGRVIPPELTWCSALTSRSADWT